MLPSFNNSKQSLDCLCQQHDQSAKKCYFSLDQVNVMQLTNCFTCVLLCLSNHRKARVHRVHLPYSQVYQIGQIDKNTQVTFTFGKLSSRCIESTFSCPLCQFSRTSKRLGSSIEFQIFSGHITEPQVPDRVLRTNQKPSSICPLVSRATLLSVPWKADKKRSRCCHKGIGD